MNEENIFLLMNLLHARGKDGKYDEPIEGMTRLTKLLFLLKKETAIENNFAFVPYKMGPFSSEIYKVIEFMKTYPDPSGESALLRETESSVKTGIDPEAIKYINDAASDSDSPLDIRFNTSTFELTDTGKKVAEKLWDSLTEQNRAEISSIKNKYAYMSLKDLLRYVYGQYPEMTTRSEIKHQL